MELTPRPTDDVQALTNTPSTAVASTSLQNNWLWQPNLIVFISSGCIMILELVAGRMIAPYVGVSLYTWTSIIGIVLAGISLGNYLGGRLADQWASLRFLGGIFLLAGVSSFGILAVDGLSNFTPIGWSLVAQILFFTITLFFIPSVVLGTISPIVAKLAVDDLAKTGSTVGKIYAAGTAGSIVGTFATGFVLISWFGTHLIVWGVALVLLALGVLFLFGARWPVILGGAVVLIGGSVFTSHQGWLNSPCLRETNYFCIKVREDERNGEPVRVLILDRLVHSFSSLNDPTQLVYGYENLYAEITAYRAQADSELRVLFIGGGGYTFPRYMEALYPSSHLDVIEIDPGVTQVAYDMLGLREDTHINSINEDARLFVEREPITRYDLIIGDAFNDFSVPYHLTTKEFNDRVSLWLEDDGLYFVNIIDGPRGDFLRAYTHTLRQSFAHVYLVPTIDEWQQSPRVTFVVIASNTALDPTRLATLDADQGVSFLTSQILSEDELDTLLAEGRQVLLTDQYAPVDQMLAPVIRGEAPR